MMYRRYRIERTKSRHLFLEPLQGPPGTKINDQLDVPGEVMIPEADVEERLDAVRDSIVRENERRRSERDYLLEAAQQSRDAAIGAAQNFRDRLFEVEGQRNSEHREGVRKLHDALTQILSGIKVREIADWHEQPW